ncbi:putative pilus system protein FilF [Acinetobacter proteolyticus]|uniref:Protein FilF n=1 Tax=Acinetobacter proteolyticus TaxID=1776741 RepID=A0A2N0WA40_9GAMM|nr:hypothetical protein [Acinetobacter proteolyticus]PKF31343.1 hypothetical protein CW311_18875 [Acinetobacter proteolyticus]QHH92957.1 hypothetical protein FPL18_03425 [Acinetobacter gyllenbergii]
MMNKKILLPFALSTLAIFLHGCGSESSKINEDPTKGVTGVTSNTSCDVTATDCLQFVLDYPVAGINFDCSSDKVNHFATKLDSNIVTGACKLGDTVTFYLQGEGSPRKINLGTIPLDKITKTKVAGVPARIRIVDLAMGLTGQTPASLSASDDTIRVAMALAKIFQSQSIVDGSNIIGDIQPIEFTLEKKNTLVNLSRDIGATELMSGAYAEILKPWLDVSKVSDDQAFAVVTQLLNLSNMGIWYAELPLFKAGSNGAVVEVPNEGSGVFPDGLFGCNKELYTDCLNGKSANLLHSMGRFELLTDRQGYIIGNGQQWRGSPIITNGVISPPIVLLGTTKPDKLQINAQKEWFNLVNQEINQNQPLRFTLNNNAAEDVLMTQGKLINGTNIASTEAVYRQLMKFKSTDPFNNAKDLGLWQQSIAGVNYKGVTDVFKVNPASYLPKDVFTTEANVRTGQRYAFPLYATLTFKFQDTSIAPVDLGIVIDEHGDIRTDIKKDATATDMSGSCAKAESQADGTFIDEYGVTQYRVGTTGGALYSANDKSITVRMILANPKFGTIDGVLLGLNFTSLNGQNNISGAKINVHNLLNGQATGINLTNFSNNTVSWLNNSALYLTSYINAYDKEGTDKSKFVEPTAQERAFAKGYQGTASIRIADQKIPACNAIKIKS